MEVRKNIIESVTSKFGKTTISSAQFFVSWNSVVTLAFAGFSQTLLAIKQEIDLQLPDLKPENPGAKWPKATLGCLREDVELSEEQVRQLRRICSEHSAKLQELTESDKSMSIDSLQCVTFCCRTLEKRLMTQSIALLDKATEDDGPPQDHMDVIVETMAQFSEEEHNHYFPKLKSQGRTIDNYYRAPHVESTLVYDLQPSSALNKILSGFKSAVDGEMPDCYAWFESTSLHMTVRGLDAKD